MNASLLNRTTRLSLAVFVTVLACQCARAERTNTTKPNIVLLFIDDWAWNGTPVAMDDAYVEFSDAGT